MKFNNFSLALLALLVLSACVKVKTNQVQKQPESKKSEPILNLGPNANVETGNRCTMAGLNDTNRGESKDIFFQIDKKEGLTKLSFYKTSTSDDSILFFIDSFDDHNLLGFNMVNENNILTGEAVLLHKKIASLGPDGNAFHGILKLSLDENLNGKVERKLSILNDDGSITDTGFEDFAEISNCEKIEALWM